MPTLLPMPWPSGPVVVSTPLVWPCSGWPGHRLFNWRNRRMSSNGTAGSSVGRPSVVQLLDARQMQHGVEQHRGVSAGEDEPVAVWPAGLGRIVAEHLVPEHVGRRGQGHRRAGMPAVGRLHGVHREGADRVDCQLFDWFFGHDARGEGWRVRAYPRTRVDSLSERSYQGYGIRSK